MKTLLTVASTLALVGSAQAATVTVYGTLAAWQAAAAPSTTQDFSGYALGTSVLGTEVLPGVTVTTNMATLEVGGASKDIRAFGVGTGSRAAGNANYQLDFGLGYLAAAFDITSFESALPPFNIASGAVGPGTVEITFADNDVETFAVDGNDGSNIFFGFAADTAVTRIRWLEALETAGVNEETALDNLRVGLRANTVPEPSSLLLAGGALLLLLRRRI